MTAIPPSDFIRLPMEALAPACRARNARLFCATTLRFALEALFDSPAGFLVMVVPGEESVAGDDQIDEMAIASPAISVVVAHRLPPTLAPAQALYESVGSMPPFLDLVGEIREAIRAMRMPPGATSQIWRYTGRRSAQLDGIDMPAFQLTFEIDAALPPCAEGDASPEISTPSPFDEFEQPENEPGELP